MNRVHGPAFVAFTLSAAVLAGMVLPGCRRESPARKAYDAPPRVAPADEEVRAKGEGEARRPLSARPATSRGVAAPAPARQPGTPRPIPAGRLAYVRQHLAQGDTAARVAAVCSLWHESSAEILPLIRIALEDKEEEVREVAVRALQDVAGEDVGDLLGKATADPSATVRAAAMQIVAEQDEVTRLAVLRAGLGSPHTDVRAGVLRQLGEIATHEAVDVLIEGFTSSSPDFREDVSDTLFFLIDQRFQDHDQAKAWWAEHRDEYDAELFRDKKR